MTQTYLTGWGAEIIPRRPTGTRTYIGKITDVSKNYKYVQYIPFYASKHSFWLKVPRQYRHELVGANRVKVVKGTDEKFHFHSAWYEDPNDGKLPLDKAIETFTALGGGY